MSNPLTIRPTLPGGAGAPPPFNANDALVWKALICKYFCKDIKESFDKDDFYKTFLAGKLEAGDVYIQPLQNGSKEDLILFDKLLGYSLESLAKIGLLDKNVSGTGEVVYNKAPRLDIFCEDMRKFLMFDVDWMVTPILVAEEEILKDKNRTEIVAILDELKNVNQIEPQKISQRIDLPTVHKLSQLGMILTPLDGSISITPMGKKVILDLEKNSKTEI